MRIASVMTHGRASIVEPPSKNLPTRFGCGPRLRCNFPYQRNGSGQAALVYKRRKRAELQVIDRLDSKRDGWEEEVTEVVLSHGKAKTAIR